MRRLLGFFARGLVLLAPLVVTVWICWLVFTSVDGWLGLPIPGAGFAATIVLITLVGFFGSNLLTRSAVSALESLMNRLPFVRLLYGSTKDLLNAFVGEKRRFDKPVLVSLTADGSMQVMGFLTQESLAHLGLGGRVAVYCPHSYNFSGQLYVVPADQVQPLDVASADAMAFVVSGGVAGIVPAAQSTGEYAAVVSRRPDRTLS
ncbi:MAG: hypothetical protein C0516_07405 [Gemmatimonas sp.]|jgi:uncharacterized membrane protein|uniref:DUF502 domain-containing protein n=1 Tax=Gemmatimonas sp. UBA7669 TaxID=1946568 RepID=UPI0025BC0A19|nr:DUF502 domain-containing protein [Gemmatimonas sp. UBA7669]MBA3918396.1 hypothetical protein [Gemmatimonas sp.]